VDKARERGLEVLAARAMCHAAETGAVPVDFSCFFVVRRLLVGFLGFFLDQVGGRIGGRRSGNGGAGFGFVGVDVDRGGRRRVVVERRVGSSAGLGGDWGMRRQPRSDAGVQGWRAMETGSTKRGDSPGVL
jgi:hypothetical protein